MCDTTIAANIFGRLVAPLTAAGHGAYDLVEARYVNLVHQLPPNDNGENETVNTHRSAGGSEETVR